MQTDLKQKIIELQSIGEKFDSAVDQLRFLEKSIEKKVCISFCFFLIQFIFCRLTKRKL